MATRYTTDAQIARQYSYIAREAADAAKTAPTGGYVAHPAARGVAWLATHDYLERDERLPNGRVVYRLTDAGRRLAAETMGPHAIWDDPRARWTPVYGGLLWHCEGYAPRTVYEAECAHPRFVRVEIGETCVACAYNRPVAAR